MIARRAGEYGQAIQYMQSDVAHLNRKRVLQQKLNSIPTLAFVQLSHEDSFSWHGVDAKYCNLFLDRSASPDR